MEHGLEELEEDEEGELEEEEGELEEEMEEEELKEEIYMAKEQDLELEEEQQKRLSCLSCLCVMWAQNSRIMDRGSVS